MSAERRPARRVAGLLLGLAGVWAGPALAGWDAPAWRDDPLRVLPPRLQEGAGPAAADAPAADAPAACAPGSAAPGTLSLDEAIDLALCLNPQIRAAWAAVKLQAGLLGQARAASLPTLNGSVSLLHSRTRYPATPAADSASQGHTVFAGLSWRLLDFGGREANQAAAARLLEAALSSHDAALQKTLASVIGAYFDALTADAVHRARVQAAELAQATLQTTQHREDKGTAGRSDTLQAATAVARARLAQQRAEGELHKALAVLIYAIGLPTGAPVAVSQPQEPPTAEAVQDLDWWLEQARAGHPAIAAARLQWEASRSKVQSVRSEGLPSLDLVSNYYRNGYPNQGLQASKSATASLGVTLNVPLFDGFAQNYRLRSALAQVEQNEAQWRDVEHQVLGDVVKAHADAKAALSNLQASLALLEAATQALQSSRNRYARNAADILELLSVQASLADAQQERIRCLSEWRSAQLRLVANAGVYARDEGRALGPNMTLPGSP